MKFENFRAMISETFYDLEPHDQHKFWNDFADKIKELFALLGTFYKTVEANWLTEDEEEEPAGITKLFGD